MLMNNKKLIIYFLGLAAIGLAGAKSSLITSIIALSLITVGLICYYKLYYYSQFFILISLGVFVYWKATGVLGIYFLAWFFTFILFYWYKKLEYFFNFGMLAWLGFVISLLFFKLYVLYEIENILFTAQHVIDFTGNPDSLTVSLKRLLKNSYLPYPDSELQFLLTKEDFGDFLVFLTRFKTVEFTTNFISIYAYSIYWLSSFIPFIKICIIIN
jgi:hypothetical protein